MISRVPASSRLAACAAALTALLVSGPQHASAQSSGSASPSSSPSDCSISTNVQFYFYGVPTNDNSTTIAYPCGGSRNGAGGDGTLDDPLTLAADVANGDFDECELVYSPTLRKYLRVKDPCADCGPDVVSVWFGGEPEDLAGQRACKAKIDTPNGVLIRQPPRSFEVNSDPIWEDSQCNEGNVYLDAEGTCIEESTTATTSTAVSTTTETSASTSSPAPTSTGDGAATDPNSDSDSDSEETSGSDSNSDQLSGGAIAGIVIGSIAAIALIAIAFLMWRRQSRSSPKKDAVYHEMDGQYNTGELDSGYYPPVKTPPAPRYAPAEHDPVELPANTQHYPGFTRSPDGANVSPMSRY